jgi:hypothetical protein
LGILAYEKAWTGRTTIIQDGFLSALDGSASLQCGGSAFNLDGRLAFSGRPKPRLVAELDWVEPAPDDDNVGVPPLPPPVTVLLALISPREVKVRNFGFVAIPPDLDVVEDAPEDFPLTPETLEAAKA